MCNYSRNSLMKLTMIFSKLFSSILKCVHDILSLIRLTINRLETSSNNQNSFPFVFKENAMEICHNQCLYSSHTLCECFNEICFDQNLNSLSKYSFNQELHIANSKTKSKVIFIRLQHCFTILIIKKNSFYI